MLDGRVALVTGASRGIGRSIADMLGSQGARVVGTATSDAGAAAISERFREAGVDGEGMRLDVGDDGSVDTVLKAIADKFGAVTILVNNAGIGEVGSAFVDTQADVVERITRINQWGVLYGLKHSPAHMNDGGSIINTSSISALEAGWAPITYSVAKIGVAHFSRIAANRRPHPRAAGMR